MEETTMQTTVPEEVDPAMEEHRAALTKMRCDWALEQLYQSSGARDSAILRRLIDIGEGDITVGEDGIPDVTAVKNKIDVLRRDQGYLFCKAEASAAEGSAVPASAPAAERTSTGMRLGTLRQTDPAQMDDASYYRAVMARKRRR